MRPLPLRHLLPLSLAILGLVLTAAAFVHDRITTTRSLETVLERRAVAVAHLAASAVQRAHLDGDLDEAQQEIDRMGLVPDQRLVVACDADDRVMHASDYALRGAAMGELPGAPAAQALVARARAAEGLQSEFSPDRAIVRVAAPFHLAPGPGELRPVRVGVLYTETDLSWRKQEAAAQGAERALLLAGVLLLASVLIWAFLRATFTRHLDQISAAMAAYTAGQVDVRVPEARSPELASIGRALNRAMAELAAQHAALRESEEKFSRIFHAAPALVGLSALEDGRFLDVNEELPRVTGFTREELIGKTSVELGWFDLEGRQRMLALLRERGRVIGIDLDLRTKDGRRLEALFSAEVVVIGGEQRILSITQDITARRQAERALRESEARFRLLAENSTDMISRHAPDGTYLYVSPACRALLGREPEQLVGRPAFDFIVPDDLPAAHRFHSEHAGDPVPVNITYRLRRADGSAVWVESRTHHIRDPQTGAVVEIQVATRDVSERKRAEEDRERMQAMLLQAQKMEAVGHLAGGVAHDFNNILTAVLMNVDGLQADPRLPDEVRAGLRELEEDARRAAGLTRQLLTFSRRQVMQVCRVELDGLLANLLKMLRRLIGEPIEIELAACAEEVWLQADPGMLEQAVINLVVNARDAMPAGGHIVLRTRALELDEGAAAANPEARAGPTVCLEVRDDGVGMDEETARRAFEPFYTTKEVGKGSGLGLSTVYGIVKQHGGWVELESAPGRGTTFRLFFPACPAADDPVAAAEADAALGGHERLLVVEDEAAVRRMMLRTLARLGYRVEAAMDGSDAVARWRAAAGGFDMLISDVVMPGGMNGLELAEQLRRERPGLKVLLMSGYSPDVADAEALQRAGIHHLPKPFEARALARRVRGAFDAS
jgi:PAS domain S-box-containing protein